MKRRDEPTFRQRTASSGAFPSASSGGHRLDAEGHRGHSQVRWREDGYSRNHGSDFGGPGAGQRGSFREDDEPPRPSFRGHGPRGYSRSDERIKEDVSDALTEHHDVDARELEVSVANGEVTLSGSVPSRHMKRLAEDVAESVRGVHDVHNQLRIPAQPQARQEEGRASGQSRSGASPNETSNGVK